MHADRDAYSGLTQATYSEVAAALGVSRSRAQQIEAVALRKVALIERIKQLATQPGQAWEIIEGLARQPVYAYEATVMQLKRELSGALAGARSGALAGAYAGAHPFGHSSGRVDAVCVMTGEGVLTAVPGP